jgi:transposase InsO family protein
MLVVMTQCTQRIIESGAHAGNVDGVALCRMLYSAISTTGAPTLFRISVYLKRKLSTFDAYYNRPRAHASLDGNIPAEFTDDGVMVATCPPIS